MKFVLFITLFLSFFSNSQFFQITDQSVIGGNSYDAAIDGLYDDGSRIFTGNSLSGISGDKTIANYGSTDFWVLSLNANNIIEWQNSFGGNSDDEVVTLKGTTDGGFLVGGWSNSGSNGNKTAPNKGLSDYWIIKIDENGNEIWQMSYGGSGDDRLVDIEVLSDGSILLLGSSDSPISGDKTDAKIGALDYWLIKTDNIGNVIWDKSIGGTGNDGASSIEVSNDEEFIYVSGVSESPVSGDKTESSFDGSADIWTLKLDNTGIPIWDKTMGGNQNELSSSLLLINNQVYTLGNSLSDISGTKTDTTRGSFDLWVNKLDDQGNILMDKTIGGDGLDQLINVIVASSGELIITSQSNSQVSGEVESSPYNNSLDYLIFVLDTSDLSLMNQFRCGGNQTDILPSIMEGVNNSLVLFGGSDSNVSEDKTEPSNGGTDFWIIELSTYLKTDDIEALDHLVVYPNPSSAIVKFEGISEKTEYSVSLINHLGQEVLNRSINSFNNEINIRRLSPGVYSLRIRGARNTQYSTLIVRK